MSLARVRALAVIGVLSLIAVITVVWAIVTDDQTGTRADLCAAAKPSIPAPAQVQIRVYNGTDQPGLADAVKKKLAASGAGAAQLLQATIKGSEIVEDSRGDASVDVVLGNAYQDLTPEAEVPAALEELDTPAGSLPAGCT